MISNDVSKLLQDPEFLAKLADDFREGRDEKIDDLLLLLNASDTRVVEVGAWIAGEVLIDPSKASLLISRLKSLTEHDESTIRFYAANAIFSLLDHTSTSTRELYVKLTSDCNLGVRNCARTALSRIDGEKQE